MVILRPFYEYMGPGKIGDESKPDHDEDPSVAPYSEYLLCYY